MRQRFLRSLGLKTMPQTLFEKLWLGAPIAVWFSFQPLIRIGKDSTMYFELSIAVLYIALLALAGVAIAWRQRQFLMSNMQVRIVTIFVLLATVGLLWGSNLTRGVLTIGVIGMLFVVFLASIAKAEQLKRSLPALARLVIVSAVVMSILSFIQFVAGIWLGRDVTLLCAGCVAEQFGFPRPNVFTIEPQFFGNLLIAPLLILLHLYITKKRDTWIAVSLGIVTTALCLTLSRGALFAFAFGVVILFIVHRNHVKKSIAAVGVLLSGFVISLCMQGAAAVLNPNINDTFMDAVSKSVNQLSLGVIDISVNEQTISQVHKKTPKFDGYVAESTDTRVSLSRIAFETWQDSPVRMLVGVGIGGSGIAMHEKFPGDIGAREIVQNEYIEILLEMGIIGLISFGLIIGSLIYQLRKIAWTWALVAAFLFQWNFFSGYPNALHIYLIFILLTIYTTERHGQSRPAKQL